MTTETSTPPVIGTPEYDAAMIKAAADGNVTTATVDKDGKRSDDAQISDAPTEGEKLLAGKFKSAEELEKAYKELESKLGQPKPKVADPTQPEANTEEAPAPEGGLQSVLAKASDEYAAQGGFTPETYAALEAQGISKEYADAYVDGLKARAETISVKLYDAAGGQEAFKAINEWAGANLSAEQIEAHNRAVTSGDMNATLGAIKSLRALYEATEGRSGRRVEGDGSPATAGYNSKAEWMAEVADPRYGKDPHFRAQVARKVESALRAGVNLDF